MHALFIYRLRQLSGAAQARRRVEPCPRRARLALFVCGLLQRFVALIRGRRRRAALCVGRRAAGNKLRAGGGCVSATQRNARSTRGSGGRTTAMLLPFSKMVSSFVTRRPSGVLSLRAGAPRQRPRSGAQAHALGFVGQRGRAARCGAALRGRALLGHVLEHHVDVHVEAAQRADQLLLPLHNHLKTQRKGAKRGAKPSAALLGPPCARIAATHAAHHGGARSSGRAARSARAGCACKQCRSGCLAPGTHPDAAAHALVHQLAGQQVRHVAAVLLGRQRHGGGREADWRRRGGAASIEAAPLALPRGADAGRSAPARLSCVALPVCAPRWAQCWASGWLLHRHAVLSTSHAFALQRRRREHARPRAQHREFHAAAALRRRSAARRCRATRVVRRRAGRGAALRCSRFAPVAAAAMSLRRKATSRRCSSPTAAVRACASRAAALATRSLTRRRARAGVAGTLAVAALAYFGADTWLNNDDIFYGSSAGLSPGYAHTPLHLVVSQHSC